MDIEITDTGFSYQPISKHLDNVICKIYNTQLVDWDPEDNPKIEHYLRLESYITFPSRSSPDIIMFIQDAIALLLKDL